MAKKKELILGIDLGTTFSLACMRVGTEIRFFTPEPGGDPLVPSVFLRKTDGEICVGGAAVALENFEENRSHVVRHVKRTMKRNRAEGDVPAIEFVSHGKSFSPAEISGHILRTLKEAAEQEIRKKGCGDEYEWTGGIYSAVITVPAYFGPNERQATRDAAKFAGFSPSEVNLHLLDEPVAAAISLNLHQQKGRQIILVVDVGGGTTDITLLKVGTEVENGGFFELGRIGDPELGGIDIDEKIVHRTIYDPKNSAGLYTVDEKDALQDKHLQGPFFQRAEAEKKKVCREMTEKRGVFGEVIYNEPQKKQQFKFRFSEAWLRQETEDIVEYCAQLCDFLLENVDRAEAGVGGLPWFKKRSGISWKHIDQLWLVGGGSLMPHLQERFKNRLQNPAKLNIAPRPQHAVAEGAAAYADMLARNQPLKGIAMPRCPFDVGVRVFVKPSPLQRLTRWVRRQFWPSTAHADQPPAKEFFTLINCNALLSDDKQRTQVYNAPSKPARDGQVRFDLYVRFVRQRSTDDYGNSVSTPTKRRTRSRINYAYHKIRRVTIPDLPVLHGFSPDNVTMVITYEPNHTFKFGGRYRGHELEEVIVREGEFDVVLKEKE